jgi:1-acyl-sn-glycerol-3-phosphate acyltransferase
MQADTRPRRHGGDPRQSDAGDRLPQFSRIRFRWFMAYVRWYAKRHFHAIRLLRHTLPEPAGEPLLIYTNHPGWWDPLIFLLVAGHAFPERLNYGPIDSRALGRYRFFERIGFIGIDPQSRAGARRFLTMAAASLQRTDTIFWVTSQGTFADPRVRPVRIRPGVAHVVADRRTGLVVPMALEYPFWDERLPEALIAFGRPFDLRREPARSPRAWQDRLGEALGSTQDALAEAAQSRASAAFESILAGRTGVGGVYDGLRRLAAWAEGRRFDPSHSSLQNDASPGSTRDHAPSGPDAADTRPPSPRADA